jgi:hypothetical protein
VTDRTDAYSLARESVERGAALPDSAMGKLSGDFASDRLRPRDLWDEYGPGADIETVPLHCTDGWGWLTATSEEWDRVDAACRPFKAGYIDAMRGLPVRSEDSSYLAGYRAHG